MSEISKLLNKVNENNLLGREILDRYTREELKIIYNGIGPDRFPESLRQFVTSLNSIFEPAALIHDVEYFVGGTKADFNAANERFRENCYTIVNNRYVWYDPRRYHWLFKAWRFYGYCEEFGWTGYNKKESEE